MNGQTQVSNLKRPVSDWLFGYHAVAFLDLMGQKDVFADFQGVPAPEDVRALAELKHRLALTIGYISRFRKDFSEMFSGLQRERPIPPEVPVKFHAEFRRMQRTEIHMQSISDSVIAWTPIQPSEDDDLPKPLNSLWGILMATSGMTLMAFAAQHPIRGGIDIDTGMPLVKGGDELYGRALNCAYLLERDIAQSPRVVIGSGVLRFLQSVEADAPTCKAVAYAKGMAARCRSLIIPDEDNLPILHFLGPGAREIMNLPQYSNVGVQAAHQFVKQSSERFRSDAKLGPRYSRLLRYFDRYAPEWR